MQRAAPELFDLRCSSDGRSTMAFAKNTTPEDGGSVLPASLAPKDSFDGRVFLRHKRRQACLNFMIAIVLMVGFILVMYVHENVEKIFEVEHAVKTQMNKPYGKHSFTFKEIIDVKEIWKWLDDSLVPAVLNHEDAIGHILPKEEWGYLADYNRIIGGMRVFQHRGLSRHCHYDKLDHFYGECQPYDSTDRNSFGYPDCSDHNAVAAYHDSHKTSDVFDDDGAWKACYNASDYEQYVDLYNDEGFTYDYEDKAFEIWIDLFDTEEVIHKRINYLKDRHWIDRQTKDIAFELLLFNGQDEPLVCKSLLTLHFSRVGYVTPEVSIETVHLSPYFAHAELKIFLEVLFVLVILHLAYSEFKEVYGRKIRRKALSVWAGKEGKTINVSWFHSLVEHYWNGDEPLSNVVDAATICLGTGICIEWLILIQGMADAEDALQHLHRPDGVVAYDDTDHDVWSDYHHEIVRFEHLIDKVIYDMTAIRRLSFFMLFMMIFLMFKTWEGIPALQGVSATINNAAKSLFSFSLILICLITLFAGAGMLAFGQQMEEFHSFSEAIVTTLIVMSTGTEEIYTDQHDIDPFLASIWHWLFVCIMYVVCLNLVLCILVDAYGEAQAQKVTSDDVDDMTLYEQSTDTVVYCYEATRSLICDAPETCIKRLRQTFSSKKKSVEPEAAAAAVIKIMYAESKSNEKIRSISQSAASQKNVAEHKGAQECAVVTGKSPEPSENSRRKAPASFSAPAHETDIDGAAVETLLLPV